MKRIWVTRASPGAEETAGRLRALGFEPLIAPLLRVRAIDQGPIDLSGIGALAFTSANGVAAFAELSTERSLAVFAVGAATARAARERGFATVVSTDGDVAALAQRILAHGPRVGAVLHPAAAEPAGDLVGDLTARGVLARALAVYETLTQTLDAGTGALIPTLDAVLLHSPRAARALSDYLTGHPAPRLTAVCLSPAVAAPLATVELAGVAVAAGPNEAALLERLAESLAAG
jgi:uroporphyrinogen-III synthase